MLIKSIEGATRRLAPPKNNDPNKPVQTLPVRDVSIDNVNYMCSAFEPTPTELEALNKGATVYLYIAGVEHPVIALAVGFSLDNIVR